MSNPLYPLEHIMARAWYYAADESKNPRERLPAALKRAWAEAKADPMVQEIRKIKMEARAARAAGVKPRQPTAREKARSIGRMGR